jgi:hypothetical protein
MLNNELKEINTQQREFNKNIRVKKHSIQVQQDSIKNPILSLMTDIDTDAISIGGGINIKSSQMSSTTGLNKKYIHNRIVEYFDNGLFVKKAVRAFMEQQHITGVDPQVVDTFSREYHSTQCDDLCDYIVDISARKIFHDEEKLTVCKQKGRKKQ